jgi:four helix bundle protein
MKTDLLAFQRLDAYQVAKQLAVLVHKAGVRDAELRDQATRAAKSTFLRLSEGLPLDAPGMRRKYFAEASGSLCETVAAIDLAEAIGAVGEADAAEAHALAHRLKRMLRALK